MRMTETDSWLVDYGESRNDIANPLVFWISVPLIVLGTVGLLWSLPIPQEFADISPVLNWGSAFLMAAVVYYFIISMSLAIGMLPFAFGVAALQIWLANSPYSPYMTSSGLLIASIVGLYLGRFPHGGVTAVLRDIQLMMIAPVWILSNIYRRFGIPY
jgi:hypothetical protein